MKMNRNKTWTQVVMVVLITLIFLALCNFSFLFRKYLVSSFAPDNTVTFTYVTRHAECRIREIADWKEGMVTYDQVQEHFIRFKACFPNTADTVLYRTFTMDSWQFWNWGGYLIHPRYKLPYINPDSVPILMKQSHPNLCPGLF